MTFAARPDISVCIANFNGGDLVLECLQSVYAQEGNFELEVLVHDDASTDDSLSQILRPFPQVIAITSDRNVGFCISNNRMVERASGRYLLLLNNDARLRPGSLQTLLDAAEGDWTNAILGLPQCSMADGTIIDHGYRTDPFLNPIPILKEGTHEAGVATGACLWIPRDIWNAVGGFPEWFESVAEDIFICLAARLLGFRVAVLEGPVFDHWVGKNLGGGKLVEGKLRSTVRRRKLSERNKTFAMMCCYPWPVLLTVLPLHVLSLTAELIFLGFSGIKFKNAFAIYKETITGQWRQRNKTIELRRRLMQSRRAGNTHLLSFTSWLPEKLLLLLRHGVPKLD